MSKTYLVKNGLNYPVRGKEIRAEAGDIVDNLPPKSVKWLLERDHIESIETEEED